MPHEKCPCGKPVGHGRHFGNPVSEGLRGPLAYYCECGFYSTNRRGLEKHLKQAKQELDQQNMIFGK